VELEAFTFKALDVRPDTLSVASLPILKGIANRVWHTRNSLLWRTAEVPHTSADLVFYTVAAL
jgi:hypothetical protein